MFNRKKRFFKVKLKNSQCKIWHLEFMRHQSTILKEEVRQELDQAKARLSVLETKMDNEKDKLEKGELARLEDQKTRLEKDIKDYKKQLDKMEMEINGAKKSSQYPDGVAGLVHTLDAEHEYKSFLESYLKTL